MNTNQQILLALIVGLYFTAALIFAGVITNWITERIRDK